MITPNFCLLSLCFQKRFLIINLVEFKFDRIELIYLTMWQCVKMYLYIQHSSSSSIVFIYENKRQTHSKRKTRNQFYSICCCVALMLMLPVVCWVWMEWNPLATSHHTFELISALVVAPVSASAPWTNSFRNYLLQHMYEFLFGFSFERRNVMKFTWMGYCRRLMGLSILFGFSNYLYFEMD